MISTRSLSVCAATLALTVAAGLGAVSRAASQPRSQASATYIPSATVAAAFAKGQPLLETAGYKIHASRREAAGMAEVHLRDTDIVYVLEGTATIVTGGEVIGATTTAPDEQRGQTIRGGQARQLAPGDVLVIPGGVPHQFTQTSSPFLYYVVKATAPASGGTR